MFAFDMGDRWLLTQLRAPSSSDSTFVDSINSASAMAYIIITETPLQPPAIAIVRCGLVVPSRQLLSAGKEAQHHGKEVMLGA